MFTRLNPGQYLIGVFAYDHSPGDAIDVNVPVVVVLAQLKVLCLNLDDDLFAGRERAKQIRGKDQMQVGKIIVDSG